MPHRLTAPHHLRHAPHPRGVFFNSRYSNVLENMRMVSTLTKAIQQFHLSRRSPRLAEASGEAQVGEGGRVPPKLHAKEDGIVKTLTKNCVNSNMRPAIWTRNGIANCASQTKKERAMSLVLSFRPLQQLEKDLEGVRPEDLENGAPDAPITSADNIVGTMSESLLYLFAVLQGKQREVKRMLWQHEMNVHRANIPDAEKLKACKRAHKELMPHVTYVEFVKETFWASLREEHPELNAHPDIGVRKGGLVVWVDTEKQVREALGEVLDAFAHIFPGESIPGAFPFLNGRLLEEEEDDPDGPIGKAC